MPDLVPANAPPASYADFTAAQRSLYGAGMLPKLNIAIGSQLPGGAQEAANGAALSALPNMPPPATLPPTTPRGGGGRAVGGNFLSALFGGVGGSGLGHQVPPARPVAPAASGGGTGGAPPETGGAMTPPGGGAAPETGGMAAAPNVIQGGVPGATMPSEVPGMLHPADHAIAYEQHLARQRDVQPFNGMNGNEFTTLGSDTPGPGPAAAVNVIRAGVPSGGGAPPGGMSLMQLEAIKPFLLGRQEAMLDPTKRILNEIVGHAAAERDQVLNSPKATDLQKKVAINTYMLEARRALYASGALGYASAGNAKVDPTTGEIVQ